MSNRMKQAIEHVKTLKRILAPAQLTAISHGCRSEEKDFFYDKLEEYARQVRRVCKSF
jgi:hypothetical protein